MKDPAFLFYPNDYIGGTMGMTFEEKGAYIEVLMMQFNRGHMTEHMIGQTIGQLWDTIKVKFIEDDKGLWFNERLELEQNKRKAFTESRRNNISGNNQYTKKEKNVGHMTPHMENENRNVNKDKRESEFYSEIEKYSNEYSKEMLRKFYNYWIEPNKSDTKMRFELEKTWSLSARLKRWSENNFGKKDVKQEIITDPSTIYPEIK